METTTPASNVATTSTPLKQNSLKSKLPLIITVAFTLTLLAVIALFIVWMRRPVATLQQVEQNNQNFSVQAEDALEGFAPQTLIVPDGLKSGVFAQDRTFNLPPKFKITLYASGFDAPRFFTFDDKNNMYVAEMGGARILYLMDDNQDGQMDSMKVVDSALNKPSSVFFYKGELYVGEENQVTVYHGMTGDGKYAGKQILVPNLPTGGHSTRTVVIGPDEMLYVSIGSSCNLCKEEDQRRAAVVRYDLEGVEDAVYASGLRNSVGLTFHANSTGVNELWSVDNGRDSIGDDIPPEEVNILKEGKDYGWPYCYGLGIANPEYPDSAAYCKNQTSSPTYEMQAHSAPLGITFGSSVANGNFPIALQQNLFIAFHGSWNRSVPTGYKVVRIDTTSGISTSIDFLTGFLDDTGNVWGRPVGVGFDAKGVMYVSDDKAGAIYRITYTP